MRRNFGPYGNYGEAIHLIVPHNTCERLSKTCFRGQEALSGNFSQFASAEDVLDDSQVRGKLKVAIEEVLERMNYEGFDDNRFRITIQMREPIGWSSTAPVFSGCNLEQRNLNPGATALFVTNADILAPVTNLITFAGELRMESDWNMDKPHEVFVFVRIMYPGANVGMLVGDVSEREGVVFFDWNHPGEPIKARTGV
ncbi:MAG: hypothetical protein ABIH21_05360 [Patescibacteria group bacterium]